MSDAESDRQAEQDEGTVALLEEEGPGLREGAPDGEGTAALLEEDEPPAAGAAAGGGAGDGAGPSKPVASAGTAEEDEGEACLLAPAATLAGPSAAMCANYLSQSVSSTPLCTTVQTAAMFGPPDQPFCIAPCRLPVPCRGLPR
jgi:hypothetical protein